jgi:hypothetical protein
VDPRARRFEQETLQVDRRMLWAGATGFASALLVAIGSYSGNSDHQTRQFLVAVAVTVGLTAVLFRVVVPRFEGGTGGAAFVFSLVALASLVLFWLGLPVPLAAAAIYLALDAGRRPDVRALMRLGTLAISTLVVVIAVLLAMAG